VDVGGVIVTVEAGEGNFGCLFYIGCLISMNWH